MLIYLRPLFIIIISVLLFSCASHRYASIFSQSISAGLEEEEISYRMNYDVFEQISIREYSIDSIKETSTTQEGTADNPGKLENKIRKRFAILIGDNKAIDSESLFIYTRAGFLFNAPRSGIFYGKTSESNFPFTISLVSNPSTRVMSGRSTMKSFILDIKGDDFFYKSTGKHNTETGFAIYYQKTMLALFNRTNPPSVFIYPTIDNNDLLRTVIFTILFLASYERSPQYQIR